LDARRATRPSKDSSTVARGLGSRRQRLVYGLRSDGYRRNNRNEQVNGTVNTRWALDQGSLDLRAGADYQNIRLPGGRLVQPSVGLDEYASDRRGTDTPLDWATRDGRRVGATLLQRFSGAEFVLGLDYRDKKQQSFFDNDGFPSFRDDSLDLWSVTPRVRVPFGTGDLRHSLVLGVDWNS